MLVGIEFDPLDCPLPSTQERWGSIASRSRLGCIEIVAGMLRK